MIVNRCLFAGMLIFLTALIPGWGQASGAASSDSGLVAPCSASAPCCNEFWLPRALNISTINSLNSPMLCGRPFVYLLSMAAVAVLIIGAVFYFGAGSAARSRVVAGMGAAILILWLVYDLRESYGQFKMMEEIYRAYVKPPPENKTFPALGDFYRLVDLCRNTIPPDGQFHFYSVPDWPYDCRIHYFLYPRRMASRSYGSNVIDTESVPYHVIYNDPYVRYDPVESRLRYHNLNSTQFISGTGKIVADFNRTSFIFLEENASRQNASTGGG